MKIITGREDTRWGYEIFPRCTGAKCIAKLPREKHFLACLSGNIRFFKEYLFTTKHEINFGRLFLQSLNVLKETLTKIHVSPIRDLSALHRRLIKIAEIQSELPCHDPWIETVSARENQRHRCRSNGARQLNGNDGEIYLRVGRRERLERFRQIRAFEVSSPLFPRELQRHRYSKLSALLCS